MLPRAAARRVPRLRASVRALCSSSSSSSSFASASAAADSDRKTTHFGYRTVDEDDKERLVRGVFNNVASRYDLMNDVMSAGIHRVWKDTLVGMLGARSLGNANLQVLDVGGGTGDIAFRIAHDLVAAARDRTDGGGATAAADEGPRIVVSDINETMLAEGRRRAEEMPSLRAAHAPRLEWVPADARVLSFDDGSFDVYTIAFCLRNVTVIEEALCEAHRVLRPGGRFLCLEFSHVTNPLLAAAYDGGMMFCVFVCLRAADFWLTPAAAPSGWQVRAVLVQRDPHDGRAGGQRPRVVPVPR